MAMDNNSNSQRKRIVKMNRRDFLKLSFAALLAACSPKKGLAMPIVQNYPLDTVNEILKDLYQKTGQTPPQLLFDTLKHQTDETRKRDEIVKSWIDPQGNIKSQYLNLPIQLIYSTVLEADSADLVIDPVPSGFSHLMFMGSGRTTGAGTANKALCAEFNGDTGNNYNEQDVYGDVSTPRASSLYNSIYFFVGLLVEGGQAAGKTGGFFSVIPHYGSSFNKSGVLMATASGGANYTSVFATSFWNNTDPITRIRLFPSTDSIASGFILSVYGLK